MSEPVLPGGDNRAGLPAGNGLAPLVAAVGAVVAVGVWLVVRDPGDIVWGDAAGPVAVGAAFLACRRIGRAVRVPRPVRAFWQLWSYSSAVLFVATVAALINPRVNVGMPLWEAIPDLLSLQVAMFAFRHAPLERRSALGWVQLVLDGAIVAVAGSLFFWYVVLNSVPAGTPVLARSVVGFVGVGCLLATVVYSKVAASADSQIDPLSIRLLTAAPVIALVAIVLFIGGSEMGRMLLSTVGYPLVGLAFCAGAYRQGAVLRRTGGTALPPRVRLAVDDSLQFFAIAVGAGLVIFVSAHEMSARVQALIVGAVVIAALVVTRQLLGLRQNQRLLRDVRHHQVELERLAMTDPLTGLANRTRFGAVLAERLAGYEPATVLLIDIDDFKSVNDTMGPAFGDRLLYLVAERLRAHAGPGLLPARLGGDEFALLLDVDDRDAAEQATAAVLQALAEPFAVREQHLLAHASIGVAAAGAGDTADEVLRNADIAMYKAKEAGKAGWVRYEPRMREDVMNHARLGSELHDAIIRGELFLLYQPVFDIVTGRLHGAESLVRWRHPERGLVSPGDFIPVAERSGLIVPLGSWVLREACEQLARWRATYGDGAIKAVNVNVAARQLREPGFVDEVAAVLSETGLLPANLIIEVTESSVVEGRQVRDTLNALHEMGIRLALDDFGTGQSSLSLLRAFPVDVLKLDKSFVDGIADGEDRGRLAVAAAVAQLADYLQLSAVAEGIETDAQLIRLREMGYRLGQGFFMAKPLPADEAGSLMKTAGPVLQLAG
jgi:diguanylate cyclase (GGDEF)-like protein